MERCGVARGTAGRELCIAREWHGRQAPSGGAWFGRWQERQTLLVGMVGLPWMLPWQRVQATRPA